MSLCLYPSVLVLRSNVNFLVFSNLLSLLQSESTARFMYIRHSLLSAFRAARHSSIIIPKMSHKPNVVFVLGGPGAGKGTQCSLIVQVGSVNAMLIRIFIRLQSIRRL